VVFSLVNSVWFSNLYTVLVAFSSVNSDWFSNVYTVFVLIQWSQVVCATHV
jgi:hypothetical protein